VRVRIPDRDVRSLSSLLAIPVALRPRLIDALRTIGPNIAYRELTQELATQVGIESETAGDLVRVLRTLYVLRETASASEPEFLTELNTVIDSTFKNAEFLKTGRDALTAFLKDALSVPNFSLVAKAVTLMTGYERKFCSARLVTDLRPVFGSDLAKGPVANLLLHRLSLSYHDGDDMKEIFLALDSSDLREIRSLVERAMDEEESIERASKTSGMPTFKG